MNVDVFPLPKPKEMLCGNACLKVLEKCYAGVKIAPGDLVRDMNWTAELAWCLSQNGVEVALHCWDSSLYKDYILSLADRNVNNEFAGFKALFDYEFSKGKVHLTKPGPETIQEQLKEGPLIVCVSSAIWHQDDNRSGGHFILLLDYHKDVCLVADPGRETIKLIRREMANVIQAMAVFGGWRICCKMDEKIREKIREKMGVSRC